jgi:hypothetical protein
VRRVKKKINERRRVREKNTFADVVNTSAVVAENCRPLQGSKIHE